MHKTLIFGCGAQGRIVLELLRAQGRSEGIEFVDDNPTFWGMAIHGARIGGFDHVKNYDRDQCEVIVALGHPSRRLKLAQRLAAHGFRFMNAVHPSAIVAPSAKMGVGNVVSAGSIINTDAQIGSHTLINTSVVVEHDCRIEDGATLSPGVTMGGRVLIKERAFLGVRAVVLPRMTIGADSIVAAGSVVTKDVPERALVVGVPARVRGQIDDSFDWNRVL